MRALTFGVFLVLTFEFRITSAATESVSDFSLLDSSGIERQLHYLSDQKAIVLVTQGNGCQLNRQHARLLNDLKNKYQRRGVEFWMINSNAGDSRSTVEHEAKNFGFDLPILLDDANLVGDQLNVTQNGEIIIIKPSTWKIEYRGLLSPTAQANISSAVESVLAGMQVKSSDPSMGACPLKNSLRAANANPGSDYATVIAPILKEKCVGCHQVNGIGPWAMTNYDVVRGFAPMIKEVLLTQRMPPWHADSNFGSFKNDRSLSREQKRTLIQWINVGAPRGTKPDPLLRGPVNVREWQLGPPTYVLNLPPFDVPATGVVPYQLYELKNPIDRDVWIWATDFVPGDRRVLHHILASTDGDSNDASNSGGIGGYVPGGGPFRLPKDSGILLKKGSKLRFQVHYNPIGIPVNDTTRLGIYALSVPPKYIMRTGVIEKFDFAIPARSKSHTETHYSTFDKDSLLYAVMPHAHLRATSAKFVAYYPSGEQEVLLSVPRFNFNWQTNYEFTSPKFIPAGTSIALSIRWDNSAQNPANPDHSRVVRWGQQSWDEMLYGRLLYRYSDDQTKTNR